MNSLVDVIMPLSIGIIMLGIGLELKFNDFKRVFLQPKAVIFGVLSQIIILPLVAFIIALSWPNLNEYQRVGLMLLSACPGGTASNLVAKMLGGRVALSISMTAFNSFIILFTIPAILTLSIDYFTGQEAAVEVRFWQTTGQVFFTVIIPVMVGIAINNYVKDFKLSRIKKTSKFLLPAILVIALLSVSFLDDATSSVNYLKNLHLFLPLIALNVVAMLAGFALSKAMRLNHRSAFTVSIELGLQNSVLALFIAQQLGKADVNVMAIIYSSFSFITTFAIAFALKKIGTK